MSHSEAAQQRLHLTGLSCAEIKVAALVQAIMGRSLNRKPARQVSQIVSPRKESV
jgi:hypothetical protein